MNPEGPRPSDAPLPGQQPALRPLTASEGRLLEQIEEAMKDALSEAQDHFSGCQTCQLKPCHLPFSEACPDYAALIEEIERLEARRTKIYERICR